MYTETGAEGEGHGCFRESLDYIGRAVRGGQGIAFEEGAKGVPDCP
jgi:hypothetical protein